MNSASSHPVAIIGAGPYGVSIAAHLQSAGIDFRIFGKPMYRWQCQMPKGMFLKSEGCASSLSDPAARNTLARYCAERGLPYGERGTPVSLDVFSQYALSFQRALAPNVEQLMVDRVNGSAEGFELRLEDGTTMRASKVIVATGLEHTAYIPRVLAGLPSQLLSHSGDHCNLSKFKGRDVTVIGAGQSALEAAALLSEEGATVRLIVRKPSLAWNPTPKFARRPLYQRLRRPVSNLGEGLELWFCCTTPTLFHRLPQRIRFERVRTVLGPAGAWWLKDRVVGQVETLLGHSVQRAEVKSHRAELQVAGQDGQVLDIRTDHVIAATGYRFDLQRLPFLSQDLKSGLRSRRQQPVLSTHFESSVPGLYFTGLASASCFGPAMRFLHGADFTARRVSHHVVAGRNQNGLPYVFQCAQAPRCREF